MALMHRALRLEWEGEFLFIRMNQMVTAEEATSRQGPASLLVPGDGETVCHVVIVRNEREDAWE